MEGHCERLHDERRSLKMEVASGEFGFKLRDIHEDINNAGKGMNICTCKCA